jgi:hypothetical protein
MPFFAVFLSKVLHFQSHIELLLALLLCNLPCLRLIHLPLLRLLEAVALFVLTQCLRPAQHLCKHVRLLDSGLHKIPGLILLFSSLLE